jgi:uncharacterized protein DUF6878
MTTIYDQLASCGFTEAVAEYNGSGDEGYIEEINFKPRIDSVPEDLWGAVREASYNILEDCWPGWEINEGSVGMITFDVTTRATKIHHGERIECIEWYDTEVV